MASESFLRPFGVLDEKWDQQDRLSQLPVEESGGLA